METVKFEELKPNQIWAISREDGRTIATTLDHTLLKEIISDEFCGEAEVKITSTVYSKHDGTYRVYADITDNGDTTQHWFEVEPTVNYVAKKVVADLLLVADIHESSIDYDIVEELLGRETYMDMSPSHNENMYSIDIVEEKGGSEKVQHFINQVKKEAPQAAYFRFI